MFTGRIFSLKVLMCSFSQIGPKPSKIPSCVLVHILRRYSKTRSTNAFKGNYILLTVIFYLLFHKFDFTPRKSALADDLQFESSNC